MGSSRKVRYSLSRLICSTTTTWWSRSLCNSLLCLTIKPSLLSATLGLSTCLDRNGSESAERCQAVCSRVGVSIEAVRSATAITSPLKTCGPIANRLTAHAEFRDNSHRMQLVDHQHQQMPLPAHVSPDTGDRQRYRVKYPILQATESPQRTKHQTQSSRSKFDISNCVRSLSRIHSGARPTPDHVAPLTGSK